jgi:hypothetical protein
MISPSVIAKAAAYRERFQTAQPFKHVCIDEFFTDEAAEALLRDFPPFDREFARNEFGEYGGKAVISDIQHISRFYADIYRYLLSPEFLAAMSAVTGIEDLHGDPTLFGGGTHENINGQELDCHVDFNFQLDGGFHRRANLLLYLNKEWDPNWGGAIELHSDPRQPETDRFSEFNVTFNRAVIFETNEYSWHGFRKIQLPQDRLHLSRKCLSIYLYTRERPAHEIAGPHGTFYVQRPFPDRFKAGDVLSAADVTELRTGYTRRDKQSEMYQKIEERLGRELEQTRGYLNEVLAATKAPIVGFARQLGNSSGLFHDDWATGNVALELRTERPVTGVVIKGLIPENFPQVKRGFEIEIAGEVFRFSLDANGGFDFWCPVEIASDTTFDMKLRCDAEFNASRAGQGGDERDLAYHLNAMELSHEAAPGAPGDGARRSAR